MSRWTRYWFAEGGRLSAAGIRIAIASSVLLTLGQLHADYAQVIAGRSAALYDPVGILMLLGDSVPPAWLLQSLLWIGWLSTVAMLVGLFSRASTAVSLICTLALASFRFSFQPGWSHQFNVVLLAHIAFLGAWGGDALSVDALIRRQRGRPPAAVHRYQFSIRLVQFAVALTYFNAAWIKIAQGGFTLAWALSDSLRNHVLVRYDWLSVERTPLANWLIQDPWRYKTAAVLNLIAQMLPLVACFLQRRPVLRFLCGSLFAIETLGLGLVMDLWEPHWLPLVAAFVDWDRLAAWIARRRGREGASEPAAALSGRRRRVAGTFVLAFVAYDLFVSFMFPRIDTKLNTYPFSAFPMFSVVRAREPYDEHQPYAFVGGRITVDSTPALQTKSIEGLNRRGDYRFLGRERDPDRIRRRLEAAVALLQRRHKKARFERVRLHLTLFRAPAPPEPPRLDEFNLAVVAEWNAGGEYRTFFPGAVHEDGAGFYLELPAPPPAGANTRVLYFPDYSDIAVPLDGEWRDGRFHFSAAQGERQLFAVAVPEPDGTTTLFYVGRHPSHGWH